MKNLRLSLINGVFKPDESQEIIMDVVANKIQFHERKKLTALIKSQGKDTHSNERIKQLKLDIDYVKSQLGSLNSGAEVRIQCDIRIKVNYPEI